MTHTTNKRKTRLAEDGPLVFARSLHFHVSLVLNQAGFITLVVIDIIIIVIYVILGILAAGAAANSIPDYPTTP